MGEAWREVVRKLGKTERPEAGKTKGTEVGKTGRGYGW